MKLNEPIGNSIYASLLVRLPVGAHLILLGMRHAEMGPKFLEGAKGMRLFGEPFSTLYGILVPYLEIASGALIVVGLYTTLASIIAGAIVASFVMALGWWDGAKRLPTPDVLLLGAVLSLLYSGPGALSFDRFKKT